MIRLARRWITLCTIVGLAFLSGERSHAHGETQCVDLSGFAGADWNVTRYYSDVIPGSTITLTGSQFEVKWIGSFCDNGNCAGVLSREGISFLVDGQYESPMSASVGCMTGVTGTGPGGGANLVCNRFVNRSHGAHSFGATVHNTSNNNSGRVKCVPDSTCTFCVTAISTGSTTGGGGGGFMDATQYYTLQQIQESVAVLASTDTVTARIDTFIGNEGVQWVAGFIFASCLIGGLMFARARL